jgi:hypothetical protein
MTPVHVMLDIETLGTRPGAMIASIGACTFGDGKPRKQFRARCRIDGQEKLGLHIEPDTVLWWLEQDHEARVALTAESGKMSLEAALCELREFLQWAQQGLPFSRRRVWANGANFDPVMIEAAARAAQLPPLWSYRDVRCHRTLLDLAGVDGKEYRPTVAHDALADAMAQADAAEEAMRRLGLIERPPA